MNLTPWFRVKHQPSRVGLYQVAYDGVPDRPPIYRYWDGQQWLHCELGNKSLFGVAWRDQWRGLAKEPK